MVNARGEDVVAGTRTPENLNSMSKTMPEIFKQLKFRLKDGEYIISGTFKEKGYQNVLLKIHTEQTHLQL